MFYSYRSIWPDEVPVQYYFPVTVLGTFIIVWIITLWISKCYETDPPSFTILAIIAFSALDFGSDVQLAIQIYTNGYMDIFVTAILLLVIPYVLNVVFLIRWVREMGKT